MLGDQISSIAQSVQVPLEYNCTIKLTYQYSQHLWNLHLLHHNALRISRKTILIA